MSLHLNKHSHTYLHNIRTNIADFRWDESTTHRAKHSSLDRKPFVLTGSHTVFSQRHDEVCWEEEAEPVASSHKLACSCGLPKGLSSPASASRTAWKRGRFVEARHLLLLAPYRVCCKENLRLPLQWLHSFTLWIACYFVRTLSLSLSLSLSLDAHI